MTWNPSPRGVSSSLSPFGSLGPSGREGRAGQRPTSFADDYGARPQPERRSVNVRYGLYADDGWMGGPMQRCRSRRHSADRSRAAQNE